MDTLHIMGLQERFEAGRKFVEMSLNFDDIMGELSVFETNIRFVGGLLSLYALTGDDLYKRKVKDLADRLLPAFDTPTGLPFALINLKSKSVKNWGWATGGASILSEFGSLQLEFDYLSYITGESVYHEKVQRIRDFLDKMDKPDGLYYNYINPKSGKWGSRHVSMGALGDSFYEYLLKSWLQTGKQDAQPHDMYVATMNAFRAGMMALHSANEVDTDLSSAYLKLAIEVGSTCHESYIRTPTGLGPESFRFTNEFEAKAINDRDKYYILRPEVIEGWFYLWRITKDPMYREWAWQAAQSIERHCKGTVGYSGIHNVYESGTPKQDDVQQSFFLAETLKYLYLIFSPDNVMALDQWIFNTEAHPLPVKSDMYAAIRQPDDS